MSLRARIPFTWARRYSVLAKLPTEVASPSAKWAAHAKAVGDFSTNKQVDGPYAGRTTYVVSQGGIAVAIRNFDRMLQDNQVRSQWRSQMRHVQRGTARRQKSSRAWRRIFAHEIRQKIQLTHHIRSRGA